MKKIFKNENNIDYLYADWTNILAIESSHTKDRYQVRYYVKSCLVDN